MGELTESWLNDCLTQCVIVSFGDRRREAAFEVLVWQGFEILCQTEFNASLAGCSCYLQRL